MRWSSGARGTGPLERRQGMTPISHWIQERSASVCVQQERISTRPTKNGVSYPLPRVKYGAFHRRPNIDAPLLHKPSRRNMHK